MRDKKLRKQKNQSILDKIIESDYNKRPKKDLKRLRNVLDELQSNK